MTVCEANIGGNWRIITTEQAIATNEQDGRCVECKTPVRVHRAAKNGTAAHFEHRDKDVNCSQARNLFEVIAHLQRTEGLHFELSLKA